MSDRRTVLLLTDLYPPVLGGLERHVDELAGHLADDGHRVHVATCVLEPVPSHPAVTVHTVRTAAARVVRFEDPLRPYHPPTADPLARQDLRRLLTRIRPDIVHGHSWLAASLPRRPDVPVVLTAHDYGLVCARRTLFDQDGQRCSGPRGLGCVTCARGQYGSVKAVIGTAGVAYNRRRLNADHVIAVSHAVADRIRGHVPVPVSVIHNWVRPTPGELTRPAIVPAEPFVMFAGDRGRHKGTEVLMEVWSGPEAPQAPLFMATTRDLSRAVPANVVSSRLPSEQMPAAWASAAVAVVPSIWDEPFSLVTLEALSAGTPTVASAVGGVVELIRDGENGVLVPPGDVRALRAAVRGLLDDPGRRAAMGQRARHSAGAFAPDLMIGEVQRLYEKLIAA